MGGHRWRLCPPRQSLGSVGSDAGTRSELRSSRLVLQPLPALGVGSAAAPLALEQHSPQAVLSTGS